MATLTQLIFDNYWQIPLCFITKVSVFCGNTCPMLLKFDNYCQISLCFYISSSVLWQHLPRLVKIWPLLTNKSVCTFSTVLVFCGNTCPILSNLTINSQKNIFRRWSGESSSLNCSFMFIKLTALPRSEHMVSFGNKEIDSGHWPVCFVLAKISCIWPLILPKNCYFSPTTKKVQSSGWWWGRLIRDDS